MSNRTLDLVVVGSVALDRIETPFEVKENVLGGSVSYACAAASFFCRPGMVGVVGEDFPPEALECYKSFGIDLTGLQHKPGGTFRWSGVYEADMINRRTLSTELNVFEHFMPELPESYRAAPFLLLGNIAPQLQLRVLEQMTDPSFVLVDTMDLWINIAREDLTAVIAKADMLMLNDAEARLLTDEHNLKRCAQQICEMGPRYVVIKKGEHGAMLVSDDSIFMTPPYPVDRVVDPTGAGDSFAGAFLGALYQSGEIHDRNIRKALLYGSAVAACGVEAFSLERLQQLDKSSIQTRVDALCEMIRI